MADEKELNDLRERIGRLPFRDQCQLLEWVFADHRRRCDEEEAAHKATTAALLASIEAQRERYNQQEREPLAGEKRAAG